jgi:protein-S-isoprenylcysteine O-methyltransferase Ste14
MGDKFEQIRSSRKQRFFLAAKSAAAWFVLMAMIFAMAGRLDYKQGWIFGGLNLLILAALIQFFPELPSIMRERAKKGPETKSWDRIFWVFFGPMNLLVFVLAVLDGGRFQWTQDLPLALSGAMAFIYVLGGALHFSAIRANAFYTSTVSIHCQQGHKVVQDGPYRFVRHPGYSGILLMMGSIPLVLGSLWALISAAGVGVLIVIRTILEDKSLKNELPGYKEYALSVKSKLFPGLW